MRLALTILATVTLAGCSDRIAPPAAPTMPVAPTPSAWIVAMVAGDSGLCIQGATVQVVAGQALGPSETQKEPCDVWDAGGVTFEELVPGVEIDASRVRIWLRRAGEGCRSDIGPTDGSDLYAVSESVSELTNPDRSLGRRLSGCVERRKTRNLDSRTCRQIGPCP
jgi:hypothetical protein